MTNKRKSKRNRTNQNQETIPASADVEGEGVIVDNESLPPKPETPQSETPTVDMPAPKPKPKKAMTCQIAGCNAEVVDRGNGQLQCKGPRRHTFVAPEPDEPPKPKKPVEIIPEDDKRLRCPWCKSLCTEIVDKKTGTISYKCKGPRRHVWEK